MMEEFASRFQFYSIGTVSVDKKVESYIAEVIPNETNHIFNGPIDKTHKTENFVSRDRNDIPIPMESKTSETIEAEWLGIGQGGNRATAPDVYKGERVLLFRFADEDKYFWDKVYNERILRRLERVLYLYSGHMLPPTVENDTKNSYWVLMSTLDKVVHFHTSVSNGEKFEWDYKLDTEKAQFTITDNSGILKTYDAPTATVTHDTDNREHFLTKDHITQVKRRALVMGSQLNHFFGPEADRSVHTTVLKPGEYINPVTTGDRRPASRRMAFGQGAFKYLVRDDVFDYAKYYEEVLRFDRHDFPNDTTPGKDKFTIWDAVGIHHDYDSTTKSTNFAVREKAYYRSDNTEFDVRVRYLVNAPLLDLGSHDMNIDTKTMTTTADDVLEYFINKDTFITGHNNLNVNAGNGPTSNVRSESDFIERNMNDGAGGTMREKNTASYSETEGKDAAGNTRTTKDTPTSVETSTVDNKGNSYKDKSTAEETTKETIDSKGNKTTSKETAEFKQSEVIDEDGNVVKKYDSNKLITEEHINVDGSYSWYKKTPKQTDTLELDKFGNQATSKETVEAFDSEKKMDDGTKIIVSEKSDDYVKAITKPDGKEFYNKLGVASIIYKIKDGLGKTMTAYYGFDAINIQLETPYSKGALSIGTDSVTIMSSSRSGQGSVSVSSDSVALSTARGSITVGGNSAAITAEATSISGTADISGNTTIGGSLDVGGSITTGGTINDIDIVALSARVDAIEKAMAAAAAKAAGGGGGG